MRGGLRPRDRRGAEQLLERALPAPLVAGVEPKRRKGCAACPDRVAETEELEHLERARLQALGARAEKQRRRLVDHAAGDAPARQLAGEGEPGRSGAGDEHGDALHFFLGIRGERSAETGSALWSWTP